jgi:hypothetical protein
MLSIVPAEHGRSRPLLSLCCLHLLGGILQFCLGAAILFCYPQSPFRQLIAKSGSPILTIAF